MRNWSTLPAARLTPPIRAEPVPAATKTVVALLDIVAASVVATDVVLYLRVIYSALRCVVNTDRELILQL